MTDPRIAAVEDNLLRFFTLVGTDELFTLLPDDDVKAFTTDVPFPLFNAVIGARFSDENRARRTAEVADAMIANGLPWLWWASPSGMPDDAALAERGLSKHDTPGMYVALNGPVDPRSDIRIEEALGDGLDAFLLVFTGGFGMPDFVGPTMSDVVHRSFDPEKILNLVAWDGDRPVGCGSAVVDGATVGLYNIATLEEARGRGVGHAVTATLLNTGVARGCQQAILHASDMGRPVYERLGFAQVCTTPQYVWMPPAAP